MCRRMVVQAKHLSFVLMALIAAHAPARGQPVAMEARYLKEQLRVAEPQLVEIVLTNVSPEDVCVPEIQLLGSEWTLTVDARDEAGIVPPVRPGPQIHAAGAWRSPRRWWRLAPGETAHAWIDLALVVWLTQPGRYHVSLALEAAPPRPQDPWEAPEPPDAWRGETRCDLPVLEIVPPLPGEEVAAAEILHLTGSYGYPLSFMASVARGPVLGKYPDTVYGSYALLFDAWLRCLGGPQDYNLPAPLPETVAEARERVGALPLANRLDVAMACYEYATAALHCNDYWRNPETRARLVPRLREVLGQLPELRQKAIGSLLREGDYGAASEVDAAVMGTFLLPKRKGDQVPEEVRPKFDEVWRLVTEPLARLHE